MAGHSQFKNIMHRKGAQDKKRAKLFNKLAREITVSARTGLPDPDANPRLRAAISAARQANMPNNRIKSALDQAGPNSGDLSQYDDVRYEGYGPGGVAVIVEALTDNRNRTAAEVRAAFTKSGGALGETNSVSFMFARVGLIVYPRSVAGEEAMLEAAIDCGADNVQTSDAQHEIISKPEDFVAVKDALEKKFGASADAEITWRPLTLVSLSGEKLQDLFDMIETLEDDDDVQKVYTNVTFDDAAAEGLRA
ncbi:MAG: YebC/PmpR family DNA-binding transcriptional regulator [Bdellovibrionales bacterium]